MIKQTKNAAQLNCGESAIIGHLHGEDQENTCLRLMELGFTPGQPIQMVAKSPFRCPVAVSIRGTVIALRKSEAECIHLG